MWGKDHVLYFGSSIHVGRWMAGQFESVLDFPCNVIDYSKPGVFEELDVGQ
jgi:hypothetical protein